MSFCIQPHVPGQEAMGVVQAQKSWCSGSINQRKRVSFRLRILCRNNFVFQRKTKSSICPLLHTLQAYEIRAPSIVSKLLFNSVNYTQLFVCVCVCVSCFSRVWLCDLLDYSLPGSSVDGISQARILPWVAMPSFRGSSQPRDPTWSLQLLHWQAGSLPLMSPGTISNW